MSYTRHFIRIEAPSEWLYACSNGSTFKQLCIVSIAMRAKDLARRVLSSQGKTTISFNNIKGEASQNQYGFVIKRILQTNEVTDDERAYLRFMNIVVEVCKINNSTFRLERKPDLHIPRYFIYPNFDCGLQDLDCDELEITIEECFSRHENQGENNANRTREEEEDLCDCCKKGIKARERSEGDMDSDVGEDEVDEKKEGNTDETETETTMDIEEDEVEEKEGNTDKTEAAVDNKEEESHRDEMKGEEANTDEKETLSDDEKEALSDDDRETVLYNDNDEDEPMDVEGIEENEINEQNADVGEEQEKEEGKEKKQKTE
ncbi:nucleolar protein 58-like [Leptopilina heterotoma]|uniref:nucleolar protein 58-like n=1 Tax=Leptopilina heterotoma TaxID=63436 RepID=UPI001CA7B814|nr:nucleolar protein 58-like [Leptopilina heterotoma]